MHSWGCESGIDFATFLVLMLVIVIVIVIVILVDVNPTVVALFFEPVCSQGTRELTDGGTLLRKDDEEGGGGTAGVACVLQREERGSEDDRFVLNVVAAVEELEDERRAPKLGNRCAGGGSEHRAALRGPARLEACRRLGEVGLHWPVDL